MQSHQSLQQRLTAANLAALELTLAEAAAGPASPAVQVTPRAAAEPASPVTPITPRSAAAEPAVPEADDESDAEAEDSEDNLTEINNQTEINHDALQSLHDRNFALDRECQHLQQELQQRNLTISQLNSQLGHGEALPPLAEAAAAEAGPATPRAAARVLVTDVAADLDDTLSFVTGVTVISQEVELQRLHDSITNLETQRLQLQQQIQQSDAMIAQLTAELAQANPAPLALVADLAPLAAPQVANIAAQFAEQVAAIGRREQEALSIVLLRRVAEPTTQPDDLTAAMHIAPDPQILHAGVQHKNADPQVVLAALARTDILTTAIVNSAASSSVAAANPAVLVTVVQSPQVDPSTLGLAVANAPAAMVPTLQLQARPAPQPAMVSQYATFVACAARVGVAPTPPTTYQAAALAAADIMELPTITPVEAEATIATIGNLPAAAKEVSIRKSLSAIFR